MLRRQLLGLAAASLAWGQKKRKAGAVGPAAGTDTVIASATEDTTPRVAVVLSSFKGAEDHDGTALKGLRNPAPPNAPLTATQLDEMVQRAIELGNTRYGGLSSIVEDGDWLVVKPQIMVARDRGGKLLAGWVADPRVVRSAVRWIAARRAVNRVTIAEAPSCSEPDFDPWSSEWDGAFGKTSYRGIVRELTREFPKIRFEITDLNRDELIEMQTPARIGTPGSGYRIPATLIRCHTLITVAPLSTYGRTGTLLSLGSYLGALPASEYGALKEKAVHGGNFASLLVDVFSFHPPDYAIAGGEWGLEGGGPNAPDASAVKHNLILCGANPVAVDAVAAAIMGFEPGSVAHLELASRRGYGTTNLDSIWTRGNEIKAARRPFRAALAR